MRTQIKKSAGWIHTTLIMALIIPMLHAWIAHQPDPIGQTLYLKCFVILFPVAITDLAINKCKGMFSYLTVCAITLAATLIMAYTLAGCLRQSIFLWGYLGLLAFETLLIIHSRLTERLRQKRDEHAAQGCDPTWQPFRSALREPAFPVLLYFLAAYTIGLNLENPALCNAALFSAVFYTPVTLLYQYVCETEHYLSLNKRTCNLPASRIYGIGNGMLAIFLLLFLLITLPSIFTVSNRNFRDIREWNDKIIIDYSALMPKTDPEMTGENPMEALLAEYGEPQPAPEWLSVLFYGIEIAIFLFLAIALLRNIRTAFLDFRKTRDENGDLVEELEETAEKIIRISPPAKYRGQSERERIRSKYRRTIRRHRKERPAPYESPIEIETKAGIADSTDGKALHKEYELARYGQEE